MPHFPHTPEALLGRNDSKNPACTCRGITSSGRACRRALASPKPTSVTTRQSETLASNRNDLSEEVGGREQADLYCWQHKSQAGQGLSEHSSDEKVKRRTKSAPSGLLPLREKSSIDTLVQKLGLSANVEPRQNGSKPATSNRVSKGISSTPQALYAEKYAWRPSAAPASRKRHSCWASLCCATGERDDYVEIVRHRKRVEQMQQPRAMAQVPRKPVTTSKIPSHQSPPERSNAQTKSLLSLLPTGLSPQTTSNLLAELVKPISPYDEDGYIYIFWLTPESRTAPSDDIARSLLQPTNSRPQNIRRISDVMTEYSFQAPEEPSQPSRAPKNDGNKKTIMLKIGRANNITRRMNEWQRQCGYALNLVRWYPYVSSSSRKPSAQTKNPTPLYPDLTRPSTSRNESSGVYKCPHIHRVERLIHIELMSKQVKRQCERCGKEHREWFEVSATEAGIKAVDETVRRWIEWAERQAVS